jgi:hypothetical protein
MRTPAIGRCGRTADAMRTHMRTHMRTQCGCTADAMPMHMRMQCRRNADALRTQCGRICGRNAIQIQIQIQILIVLTSLNLYLRTYADQLANTNALRATFFSTGTKNATKTGRPDALRDGAGDSRRRRHDRRRGVEGAHQRPAHCPGLGLSAAGAPRLGARPGRTGDGWTRCAS